jgi:hypothetical protein
MARINTVTEGLLTDTRLKNTESPQDRKHRERMARIKANPKAHAAFKNKNWERRALGSAYKKAAIGGGLIGGALGARGSRGASPHHRAIGITTGAVLGAAGGLGLAAAERRFWTRGPQKTSKWYADRMDRAEARAADPKRLKNKIRYAFTRSPKNEEADMYEDVAAWLNEQGVSREDIIYALIEAEMSDDERRSARRAKLKKWGKRAAIGAGVAAGAYGLSRTKTGRRATNWVGKQARIAHWNVANTAAPAVARAGQVAASAGKAMSPVLAPVRGAGEVVGKAAKRGAVVVKGGYDKARGSVQGRVDSYLAARKSRRAPYWSRSKRQYQAGAPIL